ncbi:MAG: hypothetical protein QF570_18340 [Myxococcota bacterium]|nr:hypothetical protein [Myxococcota bacterium]
MSPRRRSAGTSWIARLALLVAAPAVFLSLVELALALVGFAGRPALFMESPRFPGMLEANPAIAQRYFPGRETQLAINPQPFTAEKPAGAVRLVVQGGSTAAGFPYGPLAALDGMLADRLEAARPEQAIEVITTAMAAVNSYALLDFVDEIIAIEPDAVLIYAGHNEYLGIFGAGSALTTRRSRAATRMHMWLGRFRVYQAIDLLIPSAAEATQRREGESSGRRDTLMARAASSAQIPLGSKLYREGLAQFEENLEAILTAYREAGIPVFVSTLASNEVDQAPFIGSPPGEHDADAFAATRVKAASLDEAGEPLAARATLEALLELHPEAASALFDLARLEREAGELEKAGARFRRAKELDRLRFRAPEAMNEIVRRLAAQYDAVLVDGQARLEAHSEIGRVGRELMLEHLHPNARGYFLLADAFYEVLERERVFGEPPEYGAPTRAEAMRDMPVTMVDHLNALQLAREITSDFPFRPDRIEVPYPEPKGPVGEIARRVYEHPEQWLDGMEALLQHHLAQGEHARALVVARVTARSLPGEAAPNRAAGRLLLRHGRVRQAARYFDRALQAEPDDLATLRFRRDIHRALGDLAGVAAVQARIDALDPSREPNKETPAS